MSRPDRMISPQEVADVIEQGDLIEDYPEDPRGPSCLLAGTTRLGRVVHVVCSPKEQYLAVITAYLPDPAQWRDGSRCRKEGSR
jgi:hypothetical protein